MTPNMMRRLGLGTVLCLAVGCTVYVHADPPPRRAIVTEERYVPPPQDPAPAPPPPAAEIVISDDDEVNDVVYREYFGCSDVEIYAFPHYRRYYAVTDDDLYFIAFVARQRGVAFDVCFRNWYADCGRNDDRLVVTYNVPRSAFFVSVNLGVTTYPPIYQRTYVAYQQNSVASLSIQNTEYVALVQMKVSVDYQGHPPATFFAQVNAHGGNPGKVIVANRDSCGKGGVSATGARVTVAAQRPWTMPPSQRQAWHDEHKTQVVKHEAAFKQVHAEQVKRVQAQHPPKTGAGQTAPGRAKPGEPEEERRNQKQAPETQGEKPRPGEVEPKSPKAPGAEGPALKQPQNPEAPQLKKEEQNRRPEGPKQPPPKEKEKEKGNNQEEEKKGGK